MFENQSWFYNREFNLSIRTKLSIIFIDVVIDSR